jgi:hypothetical protein
MHDQNNLSSQNHFCLFFMKINDTELKIRRKQVIPFCFPVLFVFDSGLRIFPVV